MTKPILLLLLALTIGGCRCFKTYHRGWHDGFMRAYELMETNRLAQ